MVDTQLWEDLDKSWGDVLEVALKSSHAKEMMRYLPNGDYVESNCPWIESLVSAKAVRAPETFFYLNQLFNQPTVEHTGHGRIIHVDTGTGIALGISGKKEVAGNS